MPSDDLLAAALAIQAPTRPGPACTFCAYLDSLPDDFRTQVDAMVSHDTPRIHARVIIATLDRSPHPCSCSVNIINKHRSGTRQACVDHE